MNTCPICHKEKSTFACTCYATPVSQTAVDTCQSCHGTGVVWEDNDFALGYVRCPDCGGLPPEPDYERVARRAIELLERVKKHCEISNVVLCDCDQSPEYYEGMDPEAWAVCLDYALFAFLARPDVQKARGK